MPEVVLVAYANDKFVVRLETAPHLLDPPVA
jgi:hypothetical protein